MSGYFEGKKIGWRQTAKDGLVLALSIHPDDMPKEVAGSALNTRYMMAFVEIGAKEPTREDCEALLAVAKFAAEDVVQIDCTNNLVTSQAPLGAAPPKKFYELPASQQCALLCQDEDFWRYLGAKHEDEAVFMVKEQLRVKSRREMDREPETAVRWNEMVALYRLHQQRVSPLRGAK